MSAPVEHEGEAGDALAQLESEGGEEAQAEEREPIGTGSYDPEDNKLRLRAFARLPPDLYARVKAAGFSWAPRQQLFVAPKWTPEREDLLLELCGGEIGDEDTSLVQRAEERAERFEGYEERRTTEALRAKEAVARIADNIPLGQPILVGHHSERHARRDAERIRSGMRKAINLWCTAQYWSSRAEGALALAKYKELPAVRHRRIKGLESDERKFGKYAQECVDRAKEWQFVETPEQAACVANTSSAYRIWSALESGQMTVAEAKARAVAAYDRSRANTERWLEHTRNRLAYERAMLDEGGGLVADRFPIEVGGRVLSRGAWLVVKKINRVGGRINSVSVFGSFQRGIEEIKDYRPPEPGDADKVKAATKLPPLCNYPGEGFREMTSDEWDRAIKHSDYYRVGRVKATETAGAHRRRESPPATGPYYQTVGVFITDKKRIDPPAPAAPIDALGLAKRPVLETPRPAREPEPLQADFSALEQSLKAGVTAARVEQLVPTPADVARRVVERAEVAGLVVFEPSVGLGALAVEALRQGAASIDGCDIAFACVEAATRACGDRGVFLHIDFMKLEQAHAAQRYARIAMNPPFALGADSDHVLRAYERWLAPGGKLVAIVGPGMTFRQDRRYRTLRELVEQRGEIVEQLPPGTFAGVSVGALVIEINKPE